MKERDEKKINELISKIVEVDNNYKIKTDYLTSELFISNIQSKNKGECHTLIEEHEKLKKAKCGYPYEGPHHHYVIKGPVGTQYDNRDNSECKAEALEKRVASLEKIILAVLAIV